MQEKERIASAIYNSSQETIKIGRGEFPIISWPGHRPCLSEFVGSDSRLLFQLSGIQGKPDWLKIPSEHWSQFEQFKVMEKFVNNLPVINDSAERAMALIKTFIGKVHNEKDRQDLLQVVQNFRKKSSDLSKDGLKNI